MTPEQTPHPADAARRILVAAAPALRSPASILSNTGAYNVAKEMLVQADWRVLEVGCAAGSRLLLFDQQIKFREYSAVGVEPVRGARRAARRRRSRAPLARSPRVVADPQALPFRDGAFDVAFCGDLLRFLDVRGAQSALREIARVLKPGAHVPGVGSRACRMAGSSGGSGSGSAAIATAPASPATRACMALAERSGFDVAEPAHLRPWLYPPIARASLVAKKLPPGWHREGQNLVPDAVEHDARPTWQNHRHEHRDRLAVDRPGRPAAQGASTRRRCNARGSSACRCRTPRRRSRAGTCPSITVGGKNFAIFWRADARPNVCLTAAPGVQDLLVRKDPERYFVPAYMGVRGWIGVRLDGEVDWAALEQIACDAHDFSAPKRKVATAKQKVQQRSRRPV